MRLLVAAAAIGAAGIAAWTAASPAAAPAAAVTAPTAGATTAVAAPAAARTALLLGLGFVDGQGPALVIEVVQFLDGLLRLRVVLHFDEAEAARASRLAVGDHLSAAYLAVLAEQFQQNTVDRIPHEIADIDYVRH